MSLVEERARALAERYSMKEIRIPVLERTQLYLRSTGETSDIVEKQMYTFTDRDEGETVVALRPEGTPGVVRAYIEAGLDRTDPEQRLFYSGPMFRRERPQKGRYRQFYQFGVEIFGRPDAACDAELLIMIDDLCRGLKVPFTMEINSIGDQKCRPAFREALVQWGRAHWDELCDDCHNRIDRNPLRLLDCKIDAKLTASAPNSLDYLCEECRAHFDTVKELLTAANVQYAVNPRMVRGLDYYTRTAFEVMAGGLGAQSTVVAGGRYDGLVETMGGAAVAGIGFAIGIDRMALALQAAGAGADCRAGRRDNCDGAGRDAPCDRRGAQSARGESERRDALARAQDEDVAGARVEDWRARRGDNRRRRTGARRRAGARPEAKHAARSRGGRCGPRDCGGWQRVTVSCARGHRYSSTTSSIQL